MPYFQTKQTELNLTNSNLSILLSKAKDATEKRRDRRTQMGLWEMKFSRGKKHTSTKNNSGAREGLSIISAMVSLFMAITASFLTITWFLKILHINPLNKCKTAFTIGHINKIKLSHYYTDHPAIFSTYET